MSAPTNDGVPLYRPKPRRPFELTPLTSTASESMAPESKLDLPGWISDDILSSSPTSTSSTNGSTTPNDFTKRTKSILNLTTSTLFGIYSPTYNDVIQPPTPSFLSRANSVVNVSDTTSINGSSMVPNNESFPLKDRPESPRRRRRRGERTSISLLTMRLTALFVFGIGYGVTVMHLRNTKTFTPAWWEEIEEYNAGYLVLWGIVGVTLGSLLPWIDYFLDEPGRGAVDGDGDGDEGTVDWIRVVRSIGAFVGIAYGVRKLPWQSTLQVSLTLSLVNPFLWYLIDRTRAGLWLSAFVGIAGTMILCQVNPDMIQTPDTYTSRLAHGARVDNSEELLMGYISYETFGVGAWTWSVLFCSCVCFGNIGRKLAFRERDL